MSSRYQAERYLPLNSAPSGCDRSSLVAQELSANHANFSCDVFDDGNYDQVVRENLADGCEASNTRGETDARKFYGSATTSQQPYCDNFECCMPNGYSFAKTSLSTPRNVNPPENSSFCCDSSREYPTCYVGTPFSGKAPFPQQQTTLSTQLGRHSPISPAVLSIKSSRIDQENANFCAPNQNFAYSQYTHGQCSVTGVNFLPNGPTFPLIQGKDTKIQHAKMTNGVQKRQRKARTENGLKNSPCVSEISDNFLDRSRGHQNMNFLHVLPPKKINSSSLKESLPPTPAPNSPGGTLSAMDDLESSLSSPSWPITPISPRLQSNFPQSTMAQQNSSALRAQLLTPPNSLNGNAETVASIVQHLLAFSGPQMHECSPTDWDDRTKFYERLVCFCRSNSFHLCSQPIVNRLPVDLYKLYAIVKQNNGYEQISKRKSWRHLCPDLGIPQCNSSSGQLKKLYVQALLNFERFFDGGLSIETCHAMSLSDIKQRNKSSKLAQSHAAPSSCNSDTEVTAPFDDSSNVPNAPPSHDFVIGSQHPNVGYSHPAAGYGAGGPALPSNGRYLTSPNETSTPIYQPVQEEFAIQTPTVIPTHNSTLTPPARPQYCAVSTPAQCAKAQKVTSHCSSQYEQPVGVQQRSIYSHFDQNSQYQGYCSNGQARNANLNGRNYEPYVNYQQSHSKKWPYYSDARQRSSIYVDQQNYLPKNALPGQCSSYAQENCKIGPTIEPTVGLSSGNVCPHLSAASQAMPSAHFRGATAVNKVPSTHGAQFSTPTGKPKRGDEFSSIANTQNFESIASDAFPMDSVESSKPTKKKHKKLTAKDVVGDVEPNRLVLSLKSGLPLEIARTLNILNVLLHDDSDASAVCPNFSDTPRLLNCLVTLLRSDLLKIFAQNFSALNDDEPVVGCLPSTKYASEDGAKPSTSIENIFHSPPASFSRLQLSQQNLSKRVQNSNLTRAALMPSLGLTTSLSHAPYAAYCRIKTSAFYAPKQPETDESDDVAIPDDMFNVRQASEVRLGEERSHNAWHRCLCVSNILRCASFVPSNQRPMADAGAPLVALLAAVLSCLKHRHLRHDVHFYGCEILDSTDAKNDAENMDDSVLDYVDVVGRVRNKIGAADRVNDNQQVAAENSFCSNEVVRGVDGSVDTLEGSHTDDALDANVWNKVDADEVFDRNAADHLIDDVLTILCHLAPNLEFCEMAADVTAQLLDSLLHWCTCNWPRAFEPLTPWCPLSAKNLSLELLCKLSISNPSNVDFLVATTSRGRMDALLRRLTADLTKNDETALREFGLLLIFSLCKVDEYCSCFLALKTDVVAHLVGFLEAAEREMHIIVQRFGTQALRETPELIGTSVGMLRKAADILSRMSKVGVCRPLLSTHGLRLLGLTMSPLMDSKVASTIASVLYEIQGRQSTAKCDALKLDLSEFCTKNEEI